MEPLVYMLIGLRSDGVSPTLECVSDRTVPGVLAAAGSFLNQHASCEVVEVWIEGRRLAAVTLGACSG